MPSYEKKIVKSTGNMRENPVIKTCQICKLEIPYIIWYYNKLNITRIAIKPERIYKI